MKNSTIVFMIEAPIVAVKVMLVIAILVVAWFGWAIAAGVAWHYTGSADYTLLSGMLGVLLVPFATLLDAIP